MANKEDWNETLIDKKVRYLIEVNGQIFVIESVPARVNVETGENHFSPETVKRLQKIVREQRSAVRTIQTSVFEFA